MGAEVAVLETDQAVKKELRNVRAYAIEVPLRKQEGEVKPADASNLEPFEELLRNRKIVEPPFELFSLSVFPEHNSELGQVIETMEVNIAGFGWLLKSIPGVKGGDAQLSAEEARVREFLEYGAVDNSSLTSTRRKCRRDMESTGNAFLELIEARGLLVGYNHAPSYQMRLGVLDREFTAYTQVRIVGVGDSRKVIKVKRRRRFRRYVQIHNLGSQHKQVWFKELDDPRQIDAANGEVIKDGADLSKITLANPMVHMRIYSSRSPYGVPRYVGNLLSILGGRAAEEINYTTFKNNNIPSMFILVSNGALTDGTIKRVQDYTKSVIQGSDNYSKFLVIEADPDAEDGGQVKIEVKPMVGMQHDDAMFQKYEAGNADKVRRAFRIPPIFVGRSDEYTRATAEASRKMGDEQVFSPERDEEDHMWNLVLRTKMGMMFHAFKSNGPNVTDDQDIIKVMAAAEKSGGMTPRRATKMVEDIMGHTVDPLDESIDQDIPFSLQMADAVKNKAQTNEPGQQVTALKSLQDGLVRALVVKERGLAEGKVPAIVLPPHEATLVEAGVQEVIKSEEYSETEGRLFMLADNTHVTGLVQLDEGVQHEGHWVYKVIDVHSVEMQPYVGGGEGFTEIQVL